MGRRAPAALDILRNRSLTILMLGHFTVDMYVGLLPVFYPFLINRFDLNLKTVGLVSLAYSGMASISQPFFGWVADRYGTRLTGLALLWTSITFATLGFASSFHALLVLAAAAGLGSGAFHPFGAVNASAVIHAKQRNTAMSIYVTGGTVGVALGPMIGAIVFSLLGVHGTALMVIPGATIGIWVLFAMRSVAVKGRGRIRVRHLNPDFRTPIFLIAVIVLVMMLRSYTIVGLQAFIPSWYEELGYGAEFYGPLTTIYVLSSAVGAIGAGTLADRIGRRAVILWTLVLTIPAMLLFAQYPGPWGFVTGAAVGFLAASTAPLLLVMAQQLMLGRAGVASGLILGLGFIASAIGAPIFGALADAIGMQGAMRAQVLVILVSIAVAWFLPTERRVSEVTAAAELAPAGAGPLRTSGANAGE